jgi:hypothetical protein
LQANQTKLPTTMLNNLPPKEQESPSHDQQTKQKQNKNKNKNKQLADE